MKKLKQITVSQKGFGMMEVLVVMAIIPIGLLGVAKIQHNTMSVSGETKTRAEALYIAEQKIEKLKSFKNNAGYDNIITGNDSIAASTGSNANFARTWTVTDSTDTNAPNYKNIVVNVAWTDSNNVSQSIAMTTYVGKLKPIASGKVLLADSGATPPPEETTPPPEETTPPPEETTPPPEETTPPPEETTPPPEETTPSTYSVTVSGFISYQGNGSRTWTISLDGSQCGSGSNGGSYNCVKSGIASGDTPTYAVSFTSTGSICGTSSANKSFSSGSAYATQDFVHGQNSSKC